jgi:hypothetical protein
MNTKKKERRKDPLDQLIKAAPPEILGKLIKELALARPEIRRECFEFLKDHVILTPDEESVFGTEAMFALWMELEPTIMIWQPFTGRPTVKTRQLIQPGKASEKQRAEWMNSALL